MLFAYLVFYTMAIFHLLHFYSMLPETIPTRFNTDGVTVASLTKQQFALFHIGFVVFMSGIFAAMARFIRGLPPKYINIPNKNYWLAKERRAETMHSLYVDICWMGLIVGAFVVVLDHNLMNAALRNARGIAPETLQTLITWLAGGVGLFMARLLLKFRKPGGAK
ncbi:MAG TPA: hypothetical protein VEF76_05210 [Patescibacteria group bacterium]|nr:hypothetical protein [Patescibacteria group bacterium]